MIHRVDLSLWCISSRPPKISVSVKSEPVANTPQSDVPTLTPEPPSNLQIDEDELFQQAFEELENDQKVIATWSRSFAERACPELLRCEYYRHPVII